MILSEPQVRIDESAWKLIREKDIESLSIVITVQSTSYVTCCGGYEEKSLKVQAIEKVGNPSNYQKIGSEVSLYMDKDALELVESRGNHLTVYADAKGEFYSDQ